MFVKTNKPSQDLITELNKNLDKAKNTENLNECSFYLGLTLGLALCSKKALKNAYNGIINRCENILNERSIKWEK